MRQLSRRATLVLGATGAALTVLGWGGRAQAGPKEAADVIAKFTGGKTAEQGKISIELPEIAENGNTVPLPVTVDCADDRRQLRQRRRGGLGGQSAIRAWPRFTSRRCRARRKPRRASGLPPRRTSSWSPRPAKANSSPSQKLVKVTIGGCGG